MPLVKQFVLVVPAALLLAASLAACSSGSGSTATSSDSKPSATSAASSSSATAAATTPTDVCALVPADALTAVVGKDPGTGVAAKGKVDGGQCTWTIDSTHSVLAQYTLQADSYLPATIYPKPKGGDAIPGADRGFADATSHTVLVVKGGKGVLLTYISFGGGTADQKAYDALGAAILAKL